LKTSWKHKLKKCPNCGGIGYVISHNYGKCRGVNRYHASCIKCETVTADYRTYEEAALAWNQKKFAKR